MPQDATLLDPASRSPAEPSPAAPPAAGQDGAGLRGAVDNVGQEKIYGWAWNPARPEERVSVQVRLAGRPVLSARADFARPDLAGAGIGDGNHAFEIRLTPECVQRRAEMVVVAVAEDGTEAKLPFRIRRTPEMDAAETRRMLEALAASQRELTRELRQELREELRGLAAGLGRGGRGGDAAQAAGIAATQARIEERLGTLDLWLTRLDTRLAALAEAREEAARPRRLDAWQVVLGLVLGLSAGAGLGIATLLLGGA